MFEKMYYEALLFQVKASAWVITTVEELLDPKKQGAAAKGKALNSLVNLADEYGSGIMSIGRMVFVYLVAFGLLLTAGGMVVHGNNQQKLAETKSGIWWKIAGAVLGFTGAGLIVLLQTIGEGLFS